MKQNAHFASQYTIRRVPAAVDRALRQKANAENKSLNEVLLESLAQSAGMSPMAPEYFDLDDCIGTWETDSKTEAALAAQRTIDRKIWR
jgi:hypothetical protein